MAKQRSASSPPEKLVVKSEENIRAYRKSATFRRDLERARNVRDSDIDYSDIPELTDQELEQMVAARAQRFKALKQPISIRLDPEVLQWLKRDGDGYQTRINALLRDAMPRTQDQSAGREAETHGSRGLKAPTPEVLEALLKERERLDKEILRLQTLSSATSRSPKLSYAMKRKRSSGTASFPHKRKTNA
jgi:uncharacterized protein (DUF4415 family)